MQPITFRPSYPPSAPPPTLTTRITDFIIRNRYLFLSLAGVATLYILYRRYLGTVTKAPLPRPTPLTITEPPEAPGTPSKQEMKEVREVTDTALRECPNNYRYAADQLAKIFPQPTKQPPSPLSMSAAAGALANHTENPHLAMYAYGYLNGVQAAQQKSISQKITYETEN